MAETAQDRKDRYAGYEREKRKKFLPDIRVFIEKEYGPSFDRALNRRGGKRAGYAAAVTKAAILVEELGGDAVRELELARERLEAAKK